MQRTSRNRPQRRGTPRGPQLEQCAMRTQGDARAGSPAKATPVCRPQDWFRHVSVYESQAHAQSLQHLQQPSQSCMVRSHRLSQCQTPPGPQHSQSDKQRSLPSTPATHPNPIRCRPLPASTSSACLPAAGRCAGPAQTLRCSPCTAGMWALQCRCTPQAAAHSQGTCRACKARCTHSPHSPSTHSTAHHTSRCCWLSSAHASALLLHPPQHSSRPHLQPLRSQLRRPAACCQ
jgi:hypothetical protein